MNRLVTGALPPAVRLSIMLWAKDTGARAVSRWVDGVDEPLVTSGVGTAQIAERTQYAIEGDPKVTYARLPFGDGIGEATCSGTIKNISNHELSDLEVACAEHPSMTATPRGSSCARGEHMRIGWTYVNRKLIAAAADDSARDRMHGHRSRRPRVRYDAPGQPVRARARGRVIVVRPRGRCSHRNTRPQSQHSDDLRVLTLVYDLFPVKLSLDH